MLIYVIRASRLRVPSLRYNARFCLASIFARKYKSIRFARLIYFRLSDTIQGYTLQVSSLGNILLLMQKVKNHENFKVFRSKAGFGLRTKKPFRKGEFVIEYIGIKKPNKEVEEDTTKYLFDLDNGYTIDGSPRYNIARYINHSCVPNCEVDIVKGRIIITAIKKIEAGDEIAYDYGKEYFNEFIKPLGCRCPKHLKKKHGK